MSDGRHYKEIRRERILSVRVTDQEFEWLNQTADYLGLSASQVIRKALMGYIEPHAVLAPPAHDHWWLRLWRRVA